MTSTVYIGQTPIGIITSVEEQDSVSVDEVKRVDSDNIVLFREDSPSIMLDIEFVLTPYDGKDIDDMREEVMELVHEEAALNEFDYFDWKGFLSVESVDVPEESDFQLARNGTISARFLPWPSYYPGIEPTPGEGTDGFGIDFGEDFGV